MLWSALLGRVGGEGAEAAARGVEVAPSTSTSDLKTVAFLRAASTSVRPVPGISPGLCPRGGGEGSSGPGVTLDRRWRSRRRRRAAPFPFLEAPLRSISLSPLLLPGENPNLSDLAAAVLWRRPLVEGAVLGWRRSAELHAPAAAFSGFVVSSFGDFSLKLAS